MTEFGKWSQPGVPHRGWHCVGMTDLEEPSQICAMCEKEAIRYVHHMEHDDHPPLDVGCVCAERMSGDYVNPKQRQRELVAKARYRERKRQEEAEATRAFKASFLGNWRRSQKGNEYLKVDAGHIVIFPTPRGWGATFTKPDGEQMKLFAQAVPALKQSLYTAIYES